MNGSKKLSCMMNWKFERIYENLWYFFQLYQNWNSWWNRI